MIRIVTDSACDIPDELLNSHNIDMVPLTIRFGDQEFKDRTELPTSKFWDMLDTKGVMPQTSAPSPGDFQKAFDTAISQGATGILCLTISSGLSATYQSALTASQGFQDSVPVIIVDTQNVSMGEGILVLKAAELLEQNMDIEEIHRQILDVRSRIHVFAVVDDLEFLRRGGRIGGASAFLGSVLSIKPVVAVKNGRIEPESKQRTRSRAVDYLAGKAGVCKPVKIYVANGKSEDADILLKKLNALDLPMKPVVVDLSAVVGSHVGPGSLGLCMEERGGNGEENHAI
ncbi:MAG: DegV family protein [Actinobacteria bacterium]|nr:DegV family protein [Actinomycetota bacterium]